MIKLKAILLEKARDQRENLGGIGRICMKHIRDLPLFLTLHIIKHTIPKKNERFAGAALRKMTLKAFRLASFFLSLFYPSRERAKFRCATSQCLPTIRNGSYWSALDRWMSVSPSGDRHPPLKTDLRSTLLRTRSLLSVPECSSVLHGSFGSLHEFEFLTYRVIPQRSTKNEVKS